MLYTIIAVNTIWIRCRYVGHCNCATDIKEVTFLGSNDELVACSSDDGYVFIYDAVRACVVTPLCCELRCSSGKPSGCSAGCLM